MAYYISEIITTYEIKNCEAEIHFLKFEQNPRSGDRESLPNQQFQDAHFHKI